MTKVPRNLGVTLIETLVGTAVFLIIAVALYQGYSAILNTYYAGKLRTVVAQVANEEIEFIRQIPFSEVGLVGGIPEGIIAASSTVVRNGITFNIQRFIRNVDDPFDGTIGGAPNDLSPADYKLVELQIVCTDCPRPETFKAVTQSSPKSLETSSTNGALFMRAIDANGAPISGATVQLQNPTLNPPVSITDVTDNDGWLRVIDVPPANQSYSIRITKNGYSEDKTYATSTTNPNPIKTHATVALQQVTQASFAIDRVGQFNLTTANEVCAGIPTVNFSVKGSKLIGTNPDVLKYDQTGTTNSSGNKTLSNIEWDTYTVKLTDAAMTLVGMNPLSPITLAPGVNQNVLLVVHPKDPAEVVVTVKDAGTGLPLSNATVLLTKSGYSGTKTTGIGFLKQTDWSGGADQWDFTDQTRYLSQDGNIAINTPVGDLKLLQIASSTYAASGELISSGFDVGSQATFQSISWTPGSEPAETGTDSVKLQLATNNDPATTTWNYLGPDGTSNTFYTLSTPDINPIHNGNRYIRYKAYLSTASTTFTPTLSEVTFTFSADCIPSGQVNFSGLSFGTYTLTVNRSGYQPFSEDIVVGSNWQEQEVVLSP